MGFPLTFSPGRHHQPRITSPFFSLSPLPSFRCAHVSGPALGVQVPRCFSKLFDVGPSAPAQQVYGNGPPNPQPPPTSPFGCGTSPRSRYDQLHQLHYTHTGRPAKRMVFVIRTPDKTRVGILTICCFSPTGLATPPQVTRGHFASAVFLGVGLVRLQRRCSFRSSTCGFFLRLEFCMAKTFYSIEKCYMTIAYS